MNPGAPRARNAAELVEDNRRFYDSVWSGARVVDPQRFNTWPLVQSLLPATGRRLEVAPGLRPHLPIDGTQFVDISNAALAKLRSRGAQVAQGDVTSLPFADTTFDLVCAFDIVEHVDDDERALAELARVAKDGAAMIISVPLHPQLWTPFDDFVGHKRRFEPAELLAKLARHRIGLERSAVFGMAPQNSRLMDFGMWWLVNHRDHAMMIYNRLIMPLALRFQKALKIEPGMIAAEGVDEVLLVARKI